MNVPHQYLCPTFTTPAVRFAAATSILSDGRAAICGVLLDRRPTHPARYQADVHEF